MAGPNSIVLVEILGRLFFYRGVRWPGLLDTVPKFGDDVTKWYNNISTWVTNNSVPLPWPTIIPKPSGSVFNASLCCWKSELLPASTVLAILSEMDFNTICSCELDILDFLTQLSVLMDPEQISKYALLIAKINDLDLYLLWMLHLRSS